MARTASFPTLILYVLILALGPLVVIFTPLGQSLESSTSVQHFGFFFVSFKIPITLNLLIPVTIAFGTYPLCLIAAFYHEGGYLNSLKRRKNPGAIQMPNWLVMMPILSSLLFVIVVLVSMIQDILGFPSGALPVGSIPELFASLTTAPISEEWTYRITTLGLLVALRLLLFSGVVPVKRRLVFVQSFLQPDSAKRKAGLHNVMDNGAHGIHPAEWAFLGFSSIIFGLAHLGPQSNWEAGKVTTAALAGLTIGLSYLVYGAHAAILLHWFFDYFLQFPSLFAMAPFVDPTLRQFFGLLNLLISSWTFILGFFGLIILIVSVRNPSRHFFSLISWDRFPARIDWRGRRKETCITEKLDKPATQLSRPTIH